MDPRRPGPHTCSPTLGGHSESTPILPTRTKLRTHGQQGHRETVAVGVFPGFLRFQTSRIFCSLRPWSAFPGSQNLPSSSLPSPTPGKDSRAPDTTQVPNKGSTVSRSQNSKSMPDPWVRTSANGTKSRNPLLPTPSDPAGAAGPPPSHLRLSSVRPHTCVSQATPPHSQQGHQSASSAGPAHSPHPDHQHTKGQELSTRGRTHHLPKSLLLPPQNFELCSCYFACPETLPTTN